MGLCYSLCPKQEVPNIEGRLPTIRLSEKSDTTSDEALKNIGQNKRDIMPLLEGPNLLAFGNLNLSSSSSSADLDMDHIEQLLREAEEEEEEESLKTKTEVQNDVSNDSSLNNINDEKFQQTPDVSPMK